MANKYLARAQQVNITAINNVNLDYYSAQITIYFTYVYVQTVYAHNNKIS